MFNLQKLREFPNRTPNDAAEMAILNFGTLGAGLCVTTVLHSCYDGLDGQMRLKTRVWEIEEGVVGAARLKKHKNDTGALG